MMAAWGFALSVLLCGEARRRGALRGLGLRVGESRVCLGCSRVRVKEARKRWYLRRWRMD